MAKPVPARLSAREGRSFGLTVGGAFLVLAAVLAWRGGAIAAWVAGGVGGGLVAAGLALPTRLGPVQVAWMGLARALSKVTTPVLMGLTYFLVVSPLGIAVRLLGRNPLARRPAQGGYWVPRRETGGRGDMTQKF